MFTAPSLYCELRGLPAADWLQTQQYLLAAQSSQNNAMLCRADLLLVIALINITVAA